MPKAKRCIVLMQYDSGDVEKNSNEQKYREYIKAALLEVGFDNNNIFLVKDLQYSGSNPYDNTFEQLANADMILADLTGKSLTVYFELGVRLSLKKNNTIIICEEDSTHNFAKTILNVYTYKKNFEDWSMDVLHQQIDELAKQIKEVESTGTQNIGSAVFKALPNLREYSERTSVEENSVEAVEEELEKANEKICELEEKLRKYNSNDILEDIFEFKDDNVQLDIDSLDKEMEDSGEAIAQKLRKLILTSVENENDKEEVYSVLRQLNNNNNVDAQDYSIIANICRKMNLVSFSRRILEIAHHKFPNDISIIFNLMKEYYRSASPDLRNKAKTYLEKYFLISRKDDGSLGFSPCEDGMTPIYSTENLKILFDLYININDYKSLYDVVLSAQNDLKLSGASMEHILKRNMALAASKIGKTEEAQKLYIELCDEGIEISSLRKLRDMLFEARDDKRAYRVGELIAISGYDDAEELIDFAEALFFNDVVRTASGIETVKGNERISIKAYIPLAFKALEYYHDEDDEYVVQMRLTQSGGRLAREAQELFNDTTNKQDLYDKLRELEDSTHKYIFETVEYVQSEGEKMTGDPSYMTEKLKEILSQNEGING